MVKSSYPANSFSMLFQFAVLRDFKGVFFQAKYKFGYLLEQILPKVYNTVKRRACIQGELV